MVRRTVRRPGRVSLIVTTALALTLAGCAGLQSGGGADAEPCAQGAPPSDASDAPDLDASLAAAELVQDRVAEVPGVGGSWGDEASGRVVYEVASGDDEGAATCAALAQILDEARVPFTIHVFEGSTESTVRTTVGFGEAWTEDGVGLQVNAYSCNGTPEITVLEETADEVRVEITATVPAPGWGGNDCLDGVTIPLEAPIGDRTVTDLTTGTAVPVEPRTYG